MLAPVEDVYTDYLQHLYMSDDLDEDIIEETLRRLGHSTPSIDSMLGHSSGIGRRSHRHHHSNSSDSSSHSPAMATTSATTALNSPVSTAAVNNLSRSLAPEPVVQAASYTRNATESVPASDTTNSSDRHAHSSSQLRGQRESYREYVATAHVLLARLRAELVAEAAGIAGAAAVEKKRSAAPLETAAATISESGRKDHNSLDDSQGSSDENGATAVTGQVGDPLSSFDTSPPSSVLGETASNGVSPSGARCDAGGASGVVTDIPVASRYPDTIPSPYHPDCREGHQQQRHQRSQNHHYCRHDRSPSLVVRTYADVHGPRDPRGFIAVLVGTPQERYSAELVTSVRTRQAKDFGDNAPASAGLHGRSVNREPVGSRAVPASAGTVRGRSSSDRVMRRPLPTQHQLTSTAPPNIHSPAMRLPVGSRAPMSGGVPLPSTLPQAHRTDRVRQVQSYLRYWEQQARVAKASRERAMWATRCRLLGCPG